MTKLKPLSVLLALILAASSPVQVMASYNDESQSIMESNYENNDDENENKINCEYLMNELIKKIAGVISSFQPDIIFAPDPAPISECHADHLNVGKAVQSLAINACLPGIMKKLGAEPCPLKALAFYMTAKPNVYMKTTGYFDKQIAALFDNHLSQYPEGCPDRDAIRLYLKLRAKDFGLRSFHITAEGFRMLATIHMHCLPEAGL